MRVAAHQPNFLPWSGYFAKALAADVFVLMDDAQVPQGRSYASRTKVRGPAPGTERWLSIPIFKNSGQLYRDARIADDAIFEKHLRLLKATYDRAPGRDAGMALVEHAFLGERAFLLDVNLRFIERVLAAAGYRGDVRLGSTTPSTLSGGAWLADLTISAGGSRYLSGPGGRSYIETDDFERAGVALEFGAFDPAAYEADGFPFTPGLSFLDAVFVLGEEAFRSLPPYRIEGEG